MGEQSTNKKIRMLFAIVIAVVVISPFILSVVYQRPLKELAIVSIRDVIMLMIGAVFGPSRE